MTTNTPESDASPKPGRTILSVVVPCYNEEEVIQETHKRLSAMLAGLNVGFEIIYVNDGSRDRTLEILNDLQAKHAEVRVVSLSRNFGHQTAVTAGVDHACGDAVVLIDADLQDPPEAIATMMAKWREGFEVVYGRRTIRHGENSFKLLTAKGFYRLINLLSEVKIPLDTGDFRLMDRRVVDALQRMPERDRFVRGMVAWVGFRQYAMPYERAERFAGVSKYPLRKMIMFALDGILSFSIVPLRLATSIGVMCATFAFCGIIYAVGMRLLTSNWVSGWTLLFIAVLFLGGMQLLCLGIIGEYVGRTYRESKRRPLYLIGEARGFPADGLPHGTSTGRYVAAGRGLPSA
jgi:dolichol-phosphate mannosyltransferase